MELWSEIQVKHRDPFELRRQGPEFVAADKVGIWMSVGVGGFPQFLGR